MKKHSGLKIVKGSEKYDMLSAIYYLAVMKTKSGDINTL